MTYILNSIGVIVIKTKLEFTREVNTYWDLNNASDVMLFKTEQTDDGSYYTIMASLLFTAFCFEAYLNHLGNKTFDFWDEIEKIKVLEKYSVLCKELHVTPDYGKRPYQTLKDLFKFRNALAHGKSKILKSENIVNDVITNVEALDYMPKESWEEYCTVINARRAKEDIDNIIIELNKLAGEGEFPFSSGIAIGSIHKE